MTDGREAEEWRLDEALAWLDAHTSEAQVLMRKVATPTLERMREVMTLLGDPHIEYPVIHLTGTNGKTSTARMTSALLIAKGLSVGSHTGPHLEHVHERLLWNLEPISDGALAEVLRVIELTERHLEVPPSYFEILAAAALRWFADIAVDAAVVEVGLGGRWDGTNVVDGRVAVVTGVDLDHTQILGPTLSDIAREKAGIIKPGSTVVLGETRDELVEIFRAPQAQAVWQRGRDFACESSEIAHGGRLLDLRTPHARYEGVFLPLHGAHQGDNAACALAAAEAFFDGALEPEIVERAFASVTSPGRFEVVRRRPLCILDGVKNEAGARAAVRTLDEEFASVDRRIFVLGLLRERDPDEMAEALAVERAALVVVCEPPNPRAHAATVVADAVRARGAQTLVAPDPGDAVAAALEHAQPEDLVLVTGSLYLVGAARAALSGSA